MVPDRFKAYREREPVHWHAPSQAWLITRYDDVRRLLSDERLTSQTLQGRIGELRGLGPGERGELSAFFDGWLSLTDGDRHRELRRLIAPILAPSRVEPWAPYFEEMAKERTRGLDSQRFELSFARPYAAAVVGAVLGLQAGETGPALRAAAKLVQVLDSGLVTPEQARAASTALAEVGTMTRRVITRQPQADGPAPLLYGSVMPAVLQAAIFVQFVAGGYDPLARCVAACAPTGRPGGATALDDGMLDEIIRLYGPFELLPRVARSPIEVCGQTMPAGSRVLLAIGSANRDDARFPLPLELRPTRRTAHLAFGEGRHRCPASALARAAVCAAWNAVSAVSQAAEPL